MYKTYKFRIYPNDNQRILISKTFGCYRFIYNYFLNKCKNNGYKKAYDMCLELKELYSSYPWLKEVDSCSLRCAIFNLEDAYKNFFDKRNSYPKFKNKYNRQTYRTNCIRSSYKNNNYSNISLDLKNKKIKLPKLGLIDIRGYRNLEVINGRIINVTVVKETTGKYYVNVVVDIIEDIKEKVIPNNIVGIDLGIKDLIITSYGEKYSNKKILLQYEKRIKRLQRQLSRKIKGSNNYNKTKIRLARLHEKVKNTRKHYINDITNKIVKENDIIVSEKLKVKEMTKNHNLAKNIINSSFNKICEIIKWKTKKEGKYYYQIDTYYPSSKTCSVCGEKTEKTKDLRVREWKCINCGSSHDRDINASINIMFEGLKKHYQN
jgi:putative transposase